MAFTQSDLDNVTALNSDPAWYSGGNKGTVYFTYTGALLSIAFAGSLFIAEIIFTTAFRESAVKSQALGTNILGAVAGGLAQNLSFIFGIKALLLIAAVCYAVAALCRVETKAS